MIKSVETIAIEAARQIDRLMAKSPKRSKHVMVTLHPDINAALLSDQARILSDIQRKYRCKIDIVEDKSLHIEETIIVEK
jgi:Ribonuclease G/E